MWCINRHMVMNINLATFRGGDPWGSGVPPEIRTEHSWSVNRGLEWPGAVSLEAQTHLQAQKKTVSFSPTHGLSYYSSLQRF